jgi:hypothetical protein
MQKALQKITHFVRKEPTSVVATRIKFANPERRDQFARQLDSGNSRF